MSLFSHTSSKVIQQVLWRIINNCIIKLNTIIFFHLLLILNTNMAMSYIIIMINEIKYNKYFY